MSFLVEQYRHIQAVGQRLQYLDGLPPLLLRLYLAPIMMQAGWNKLSHFSDTAAWFGNPDWGLGLPFPELMAALATGTELIGGALLVVGLATRWVSIPLLFTMLVAALSVHWENGWLAIADGSSWLANDRVLEAGERLSRAKDILPLAIEEGVMALIAGPNVLRMAPSLVIPEEDIAEGMARLERAIKRLVASA